MIMTTNDTVWQGQQLTTTFLEGIRGAIPFANEQIDIMLRLIRASQSDVRAFLDLGCGDGILGHAIYRDHPQAQGVFADFSEPMLTAARERLTGFAAAVMQIDYGDPAWVTEMTAHAPFDVIVSGYSIHHQPDERKQAIYREIYDLLATGGIFVNVEHVSSSSEWIEARFEELFIDSIYAYHQQINGQKTRQELNKEFYDRPDKAANILVPVEQQCDWLREIGFAHVDCYLKVFELAVFGGIKKEL